MLTQNVVKKQINALLANTYERAMLYHKRSFGLTSSSAKSRRERAIAKALAVETTAIYNMMIRTLGPLGTSDRAIERLPLIDTTLKLRVEMLEEDEIEDLANREFAINTQERKTEQEMTRQEFLDYIAKHPNAVAAMTSALDCLANSVVPRATKTVDERRADAVRFARKGGLVKHFMNQGLPKEAANRAAEQAINAKEVDDFDKKQKSSIPVVEIEQALAIVDNKPYSSTRDQMLDLLTPTESENSYDNNNSDSAGSDISDFSVFDSEDQVQDLSTQTGETNTAEISQASGQASNTEQLAAAELAVKAAGVRSKK